jgi:hypothetical protein
MRKALSDLRAQFDRWDRGEINALELEVLLEGDHVEQRSAGLHINEQIDVTGGSIVTACNRPKHANIPCAMTRGQERLGPDR